MMQPVNKSPEEEQEKAPGNGAPSTRERKPGRLIRQAALASAPTILIVYPLVGFGIGYLGMRLWNWPAWVAIITLLMGLVQGMREVYRLGQKSED